MKKRNRKIKTFYTRKQVCFDSIDNSYSKSPLKPYLLMKQVKDKGLSEMLDVTGNFKPFRKQDFRIAHTKTYIDNFFAGKGNYRSNALPWSRNLVNSVCLTNASLHNAIEYAIKNPETVTFAPVSGMHHATPTRGGGFCTFSGQAISAIKIYEQYGLRGAYLDLDAHFGNSIEDTRKFNKTLNEAIPKGCNVNPSGTDWDYVKNFNEHLTRIGQKIFTGFIDYVIFAHGADSHSSDDLSGHMNTETWLECSIIFAKWVKEVEFFTGKHLPITLALFGGYRKDNYESVLNLHIKSIANISNILCDNNFDTSNLKIIEKEKETFSYTFANE